MNEPTLIERNARFARGTESLLRSYMELKCEDHLLAPLTELAVEHGSASSSEEDFLCHVAKAKGAARLLRLFPPHDTQESSHHPNRDLPQAKRKLWGYVAYGLGEARERDDILGLAGILINPGKLSNAEYAAFKEFYSDDVGTPGRSKLQGLNFLLLARHLAMGLRRSIILPRPLGFRPALIFAAKFGSPDDIRDLVASLPFDA